MALPTNLARTEVEALARRFGLAPRGVRHLRGGVENTSYVVAAEQGDFVLTILEKRDFAAATAYAEFLQALGRTPVPAPRLLRTLEGGEIGECRGKPVVALEFVHGVCRRYLAERHLHDVGAALARLHRSGAECAMKPYVRFDQAEIEDARALPNRELSAWLTGWHARVAGALEAPYPSVPTHGDPFPDNVVVRPEGGIVLIDWEDAACDSPLVDLGMALLGLSGRGGLFVPRRASLVLAGYRSHGGIVVSGDDLRAATIYLALVVAYRRHAKPASIRGRADHRRIRQLVESLVEAWASVDA